MSIITILLFGGFWWIGGLKQHNENTRKDGHNQVNVSKKQYSRIGWWSELLILPESIVFSATVFLSGTRLFIDPPEHPEMLRWSRSQVKTAFTIERILGAFFSILFFLAISGTVVR